MSKTALEIILNEVHRIIPKPLLKSTFGRGGVANPKGFRSIDYCLYEQVWRPITLPHINLTVGRVKIIPIKQHWRVHAKPIADGYYANMGLFTGFYRIPSEAREWADIVEVEKLDCNYATIGTGIGEYTGAFTGIGNSIMNMNSAMMEMRTRAHHTREPEVYKISSNMIEVTPDPVFTSEHFLHCLLNYNLEFTNAHQTLIEPARRLFLADVKSFIYRNLDIETDTAAVVGGMEIGRFRDRLSEYANAEQEREEFLTTLRGQSYHDPKTQIRLLNYML